MGSCDVGSNPRLATTETDIRWRSRSGWCLGNECTHDQGAASAGAEMRQVRNII